MNEFQPTHYLRVEGVNFDAFLFDTADLSTIRGGSLALLGVGLDVQAVLERQFGGKEAVQQVQTGASSGLYALRLPATVEPKAVREHLAGWQQSHDVLRHATLSVDLVPAAGGFAAALARLQALNRTRQLQAASLVMPAPGVQPCELDYVRPAADSLPDPDNRRISSSVKARHQQGRSARRGDFYLRETGRDWGKFTEEFAEICAHPPSGCGHVAGKLALVYLDGNKFGAHFEELARRSDKEYADFAEWLQKQRRALLTGLLARMDNQPSDWLTAAGRRRLEVLLWGGDELLFVVPAWQGWETLALLGEAVSQWRYPEPMGKPLTHAASLVFAGCKAPIHTLRRLTRKLADTPKEKDRAANLALVEVLDSFDHVGPEVDDYYRARLPKWLHGSEAKVAENLVLPLERLGEFATALDQLKTGEFPRRQIQRAAHAVAAAASAASWDAFGGEELKDRRKQFPALDTLAEISGGPAVWLHLADLWDYVALTPNPPAP